MTDYPSLDAILADAEPPQEDQFLDWPSTVSAMERARSIAVVFEQRIDAALQLHRKLLLHEHCPHDLDADCDRWETIDGEWVCGPVVAEACEECYEDDGSRVDYPCATVRALTPPEPPED